MAGVAIQRDGSIFGSGVDEIFVRERSEAPVVSEVTEGELRIINTTALAEDVIGYAGTTPVEVHIVGERIEKVVALENVETPSYMNRVLTSGFMNSWDGMTLKEAASVDIDAVSGATYTSVAVNGNVKRAAQYAAKVEASQKSIFANFDLKTVAGLVVILLATLITLAKFRQKWLIIAQLVLNVAVLGFWCKTFLSMSAFVSWASNGINLSLSIVTVVMFIIILLLPLFNRKGAYCHIYCPLGSAQELLGMIPIKKLKLKPAVNSFLNKLRYYILFILFFVMCLGVGFELMNYEAFSVFLFNSASTFVLVLAGLFLVLSLFIQRPYCRFVCPTGALLTMSYKTK